MPRLWADERAVRQICSQPASATPSSSPRRAAKSGSRPAGPPPAVSTFSVKDTGPGIPEEEIPIVLASFGQGSNSIKSAEQGAGSRPADRQEPGRPARRHVHAEIETAHRHRGARHLPAGAGDGRARPDGASPPPALAAPRPNPPPTRRKPRLSGGGCSGPAPETSVIRDHPIAFARRLVLSSPANSADPSTPRSRPPATRSAPLDPALALRSAAGAPSPKSPAGSASPRTSAGASWPTCRGGSPSRAAARPAPTTPPEPCALLVLLLIRRRASLARADRAHRSGRPRRRAQLRFLASVTIRSCAGLRRRRWCW